jgi:SAM-dependent methyltransferase
MRRHALCPSCGALERHRLQFLALSEILKRVDPASLKMLHVAPESFFRSFFAKRFGSYETADLDMKDVDHHVDLQALPFADGTYDFIFASHVLEHVPDDERAIREIRRVLRPGGIAVLPVPLVCERTVEYPEPNPNETNHVRAPGLDYLDRYEHVFARVERFTSESFPARYQLFVYEDRSQWPTPECPLRPPMPGEKHIDVTPVCYA